MTQKDEALLLKDLCARLPYGVIVSYQVGKNTPINRVLTGKALDELVRDSYVDEWLKCSFKPYLCPMSSMTEEEADEWAKSSNMKFDMEDGFFDAYDAHLSIDWLNENHFDYRGLIEKGLALEAPVDMYKTE